MTGVVLVIGPVILTLWLYAMASGESAYATIQGVLNSWLGMLALFLLSVALFYHLFNGIRHLLWDLGVGLELKSAYLGGYAVLTATAVTTVLLWVV
jgi:succinate dehydrogenase / fumarate reductase cytochrome b subunit